MAALISLIPEQWRHEDFYSDGIQQHMVLSYSNKYNSPMTYGPLNTRRHTDPYGHRSKGKRQHNPNLGSFFSVFVFKKRDSLWLWLTVTHPGQSVMAFGSKGKEDRGRSKRQNNDKGETARGALPCSRDGWRVPAKANKQLKCSSIHFA